MEVWGIKKLKRIKLVRALSIYVLNLMFRYANGSAIY